jgi:hypothetical protein
MLCGIEAQKEQQYACKNIFIFKNTTDTTKGSNKVQYQQKVQLPPEQAVGPIGL